MHADLQNPTYVAWRQFLAGAEGWSADRIAEYQLAELQRVVQHAYERTVGYRDRFDAAGVHPADLRSLDDVARIPPIDKPTLRDRVEEFSVAMDGRLYTSTGGSTGVPFGFWRDPDAFPKELASKAHQYARLGWREGDRQIVFRGLPIETPDRMQFVEEFEELRCSSYHLTPERMEAFRVRAWEYRPDWIRCYPSSGYLFAQFLRETGRAFPPVRGMLCASENLYGFQRTLFAEVFGGRIFTHYGHYELAVLAGYCETEDTYHVLPHYGYAELLDPEGRVVTQPGAVGEIVGTSFLMHATPFVRYRTGDLAVYRGVGCPACGRPYQIWDRIEGRLQEFIVTGTGRYISMTAINFHDDIFEHLVQFQFHQHQRGAVTFRYIPKASCTPATVQDIERRLRPKLGDDVVLHAEAVADIPPTHRGKHRFLIQELQVPFHDV